jgi:hypothetical protein
MKVRRKLSRHGLGYSSYFNIHNERSLPFMTSFPGDSNSTDKTKILSFPRIESTMSKKVG